MISRAFPAPVKFICGFIYHQEDIYKEAKKVLINNFGNIDFESSAINFNFTDYYYTEFNKPLFRRFVSFESLRKPDEFISVKLYCIKVEKKFSLSRKRKINIDPGYLNEAKLVLTTTKDFSHRIYLGKGIYAEVTLYYKGGKFCNFPTTFPDYRTSKYKDIFVKVREIYHSQI